MADVAEGSGTADGARARFRRLLGLEQLDVAPTPCATLGVEFPDATGSPVVTMAARPRRTPQLA